MDLTTLADRHLVCLCIWGEARGEPVEGQIAVGNVIRNRWRDAAGATWQDIVLKPNQFSCFRPLDVNYPKVQRAAVMLTTAPLTPALAQALWIADGILGGVVLDVTDGATHYCVTSLAMGPHPPKWTVGEVVLRQIGAHSFYNVA